MKYPVGTKCWQIASYFYPADIGSQVTVLSHWTPHSACPCLRCGAVGRDVEITPGKHSTCCCSLVPIDDPDAAVAVKAAREEVA